MSRHVSTTGCAKNQRGASLVFVAVALTSLLGFFALAIDIGYYLVVRNELQNAADAAALSGASDLFPFVGNTPNFNSARAKALSALKQNTAANVVLTTGDITTGYWNITGFPTGLHTMQDTDDLPAIQVIIKKSAAQNGGGVATFFAGILGIDTLDGAAVAVAVAGVSPGFTLKSMFPVVISQCLYDTYNYWDSVTHQPINTGTGQPHSFAVGSIDSGGSACGSYPVAQWALLGSSGDIITLIDNVRASKLTSKISIGDTFSTTTDVSAYSQSANSCAGNNNSCDYVLVPVVNVSNVIVGFACLHIIPAGTTTITLQMASIALPSIDNKRVCKMSDSGGNGPSYGVAIPPKLVNYLGNP